MTGGDAFRDQLKDYQDRLALLDRSRDDVELVIEQYRSEHKSVATSLAILRISPVEQPGLSCNLGCKIRTRTHVVDHPHIESVPRMGEQMHFAWCITKNGGTNAFCFSN